MRRIIVSEKYGLVYHPHYLSGDMSNGFCLLCQKVHATIIDEPLNPTIRERHSFDEPEESHRHASVGLTDPFTKKPLTR